MEIDFIPFQIGMQYENWEFDLEPVYDDKILDKYKYIRDDIKALFNHDIEAIYLSFDLEILYKVEIIFRSKSLSTILLQLETLLKEKYLQEFKLSQRKMCWSDDKKRIIIGANSKAEIFLSIIDNKHD